jgi:hypothetical protein
MAQFIKHVGVNGQGKKCVVVFRELPGDSDSALIIPTEALPQLYHDDLISAIEHPNCQDLMDPSDYLFRQVFNDGTNMLNTLHVKGWMVKVPTKSVAMTPRPGVTINLVDLNRELKQITNAETAAGTRSSDIANNAPANNPPGVITDEALASKYRVQANQFETEARRLREEAAKLDPKGAAVVAPVSPMQSAKATSEVVKRGRGRPAKAQAV